VGVTSFGFFVQIQEVFVEGLVARESLAGDTYFFDATRANLRGKRTGKVFRMGQSVRVRLAAAHTDRRQLDFVLL
jgi:ribonuclease R